jgi:photosystem II stability/assembly factor-like uncharacterized protein
MKHKRVLCVLRLAMAMMMVSLLFTSLVWAQETGFIETFDDPALPGWEHSPNASVEAGVLHINGDGFAFHGGLWDDMELVLRARRMGDGELLILYSWSDEGAYLLRLGMEVSALQRDVGGQLTEFGGTDVSIMANEWFEVKIIAAGGNHEVYLNDELFIVANDPDRLPPGGLGFRVEGDALGEFDELSLTSEGVVEPVEGEAEETPGKAPSGEILPLSQLTWVRTGGPPGGLGYDIRYNFDDPTIWYVTDTSAGVSISTDNGYTWEQSNSGIETLGGATGDSVPIFCLTVDPHNPQIIWAGTDKNGHIYKSIDGGLTWEEKNEGVTIEYDMLSFRGFTVDPRTSDIVYAMGETALTGNNVWGDRVGGVVYKTENGGEHWELIWDGGMPSSLARYMWIDPRDPDVLYVSTGIFDRGAIGEGDPATDADPYGGLGILKSIDGGVTWRELNEANGLMHLYIGSLYMHPDDPDVLLAAAGHMIPDQTGPHFVQEGRIPWGIYRTTDGGETWVQVLEPAPELVFQVFSSVELCPSDPNIAYAGSDLAIYRSDDAGATWDMVAGSTAGWGPPGVKAGFPIDMQCDPRDANRIFVNNYSGGNFLSEDGGRTWQNASKGYTGAQLIGIAVDPFNPARVFVGGRSGAWYTEDAGDTWYGLQNPGDPTPIAGGEQGGVAFDPSRGNHILIGGGDGILEWVASESLWQGRSPAPPYGPETSVIVYAPSDPSVVYAGSADHNTMVLSETYEGGEGVIVSYDGGTSWANITGSEFLGAPVTDLFVDPTDFQIAYAATQRGLFKTADGGQSWTRLSGLPGEEVRSVGISPADPSHILAGLYGRGLYLSSDGGGNWQQISAGLEPNGNHRDIIFDPTNPDVVYTSDIASGVYRSEDGGLSWFKLSKGLTNRSATGLSLSADGLHLYAATSGGGVYRMDLNGQPPVSTGSTLLEESAEEAEPTAMETQETQPEAAPEAEEPTDERGFRLPCLGGAIPLALVGVILTTGVYARGRMRS